jgi:cytochrome c-type biogenesis protein CcmF
LPPRWWAALGVRSGAALVAGGLALLAGAAAVRDLVRAARGRDSRLLGAAMAHTGVAMAALAFAGPPLVRDAEGTLRTGQALGARDPWGREWRFVSDGLSDSRRENYIATYVSLSAMRAGRRQALLTGERRQYLDVRQRPVALPLSVPGVAGSALQDIRVTLVDAEGEDEAHVRVTFVPLARLVWYGALAMLAGGLIALLAPAPRRAAPPEAAA